MVQFVTYHLFPTLFLTDDVEGDEEAQIEEQFERLAVIARAAPFSSLPLLSQRLEECMGHVASATQNGSDTTAPFEILCWLLQVAAFVLADDGAGEDPLPPVALSAALEHDTNTSPNPVATLSFSLLNVASACLGLVNLPQGPPSPRLMEILVVVLGRWADTYLLAEEGIVPALDASFGASGEGPHIANALVNFASACLNHFAGESQLHKVRGVGVVFVASAAAYMPLHRYSLTISPCPPRRKRAVVFSALWFADRQAVWCCSVRVRGTRCAPPSLQAACPSEPMRSVTWPASSAPRPLARPNLQPPQHTWAACCRRRRRRWRRWRAKRKRSCSAQRLSIAWSGSWRCCGEASWARS